MRRRVIGRVRSWADVGATAVLPPYRQSQPPLRRAAVKTLFLCFCAGLGFFDGFVFAVFPPAIMIYLALPVLLLALIVIWALPDFPTGPTRLLGLMFFAYSVIIPLWPNYLALSLPGLPWISFRRLLIFPMALVFFIGLSTSPPLRAAIREAFLRAKVLPVLVLVFAAMQLITIGISKSPFGSLNIVLDSMFGAIIPFFIGLWLFQDSGRAYRWQAAIVWAALALCVIGALEWANQGVLWANHIPSFLAVGDEAVQRILEPDFRDGRYRVTTTYSVSLAFAEFLAFATPFVIHRIFRARCIPKLVLWAAMDLLLLLVIVSTQARLGIVGWLAAHIFYFGIWSFRRWRFTKGDMISPALSLMYPAGAILFLISLFTVDAVKFRVLGGGSTRFSDDARREQFELFWPELFGNPIGHGAGQSGVELGFTTPDGLITVDSYFITVGIDYGVVGLIAFFGGLLFAIYQLGRVAFDRPYDSEDDPLPVATMLVVALLIRSVLSQADNLALINITLGMAAAVLVREARNGAVNTAAGAAAPLALQARPTN
jgi:hypothetical protein